ncbi:MAG: DUF3784 domain-containing protein [Oscillospiraceae bacterium]|jgi:hypothetical protein|nr:DUF3784 domain-containing protein [Oscillospiraceae bacterium]
MNAGGVAALIITGLIGLLLVSMGIVLLTGRGAFLIAGYNTMSKSEKAKYDAAALCRFMGKILLPIGLLTPSVALGAIYGISWVPSAYIAATVALVVFAAVYANTGNRFRK